MKTEDTEVLGRQRAKQSKQNTIQPNTSDQNLENGSDLKPVYRKNVVKMQLPQSMIDSTNRL